MERNVKYLIIGAGISGLTFANYADGDYLIVEKEDEVGGYAVRSKKKIMYGIMPDTFSISVQMSLKSGLSTVWMRMRSSIKIRIQRSSTRENW